MKILSINLLDKIYQLIRVEYLVLCANPVFVILLGTEVYIFRSGANIHIIVCVTYYTMTLIFIHKTYISLNI